MGEHRRRGWCKRGVWYVSSSYELWTDFEYEFGNDFEGNVLQWFWFKFFGNEEPLGSRYTSSVVRINWKFQSGIAATRFASSWAWTLAAFSMKLTQISREKIEGWSQFIISRLVAVRLLPAWHSVGEGICLERFLNNPTDWIRRCCNRNNFFALSNLSRNRT